MKALLKKMPWLTVITTPWFMVSLFLFLPVSSWAQTSTVVIAEVLYDYPLNSTTPGHEGEFLSLYNYGEEDVDISGWRVEIIDLGFSPQPRYLYTVPSQTLLPALGLAVIASRAANSTFDVGLFYGVENLDTMSNLVLYNQSLAFPETRSVIRIYDAQNRLEDELDYTGNYAYGYNSIGAENKYYPYRPIEKSVSIQRKNITVIGDRHIISQTDYYLHREAQIVQLFSYLPASYSYAADPSSSGPILAPTPTDLSLTGTTTGNKDYRASNIASTQVIESGKTTYWAEDEIVLGDGFEVKAGAEFEASIERDSIHHVTMLTYNLWRTKTDYAIHAEVIKASQAGVVSVQEIKRETNFKKLKEESGYSGEMCVDSYSILTLGSNDDDVFGIGAKCGIGLLWDPALVGDKIRLEKRTIWTPDTYNKRHSYMIAEFSDFCFVSTHYSVEKANQIKMTEAILNNGLVRDCQTSGKPVYVAGDMNAEPGDESIEKFTDNNGFEVLNDTTRIKEGEIIKRDDNDVCTTTIGERYKDATGGNGTMIDLILEYNTNEYHKTIDRGIHISPFPDFLWTCYAEDEQISDHKPYRVRVKIK